MTSLRDPGETGPSAGEWLYVEQLLDSLSPRARKIIELSVFAGLTSSEIGRDMGLDPGTVRVSKLRALKKLRAMLGADVTPEGGHGDE
jgi:DNA-directed RNA polymerase specialized sigma24 family protein